MKISTEKLKELREQSGASIMACRNALIEAEEDMGKALEILKQKNVFIVEKKKDRFTSQGLIEAYVHTGGRIGAMIELNCESDFVARTDDFKELVKDVAMHIAAANPTYLSREDVTQDVIDREKEIYKAQVTGKPAQVVDKIVEGKLEKFYTDTCLLDQIFVKDPDGKKKIKDLVTEKVAKLGENIVIRRFARFQLGETQPAEPKSC